jgi:hypothetical protein
MVADASRIGATFSERDLGFGSFLEFVKAVPDVAVQVRIGSDMLLAPATAGETLSAYAYPLPRLRRDFWRAFIEFPIPDTVRLYDPGEDKVFYENIPTQRNGITIEPVSRETQLQWRRAFSDAQAENVKGDLLASLVGTGTATFNAFARCLREKPSVLHAWNRYLQKQITDHVAAWAASQDVPEERWRGDRVRANSSSACDGALAKPQSISQRAELYNFFDSLPLDDLLQLRVPLEWILKVTRERK